MTGDEAERIITGYLKPIYGFALKRCVNLQDAEDLAQEIILRAYRALRSKDDIGAADKFIWTVAHNAFANYCRDRAKTGIGISLDALEEQLPAKDDTANEIIEKESIRRLHLEIAYLSKIQRRIVIAYFYENKKQEAIAKEQGIPIGTVKWHLFAAKKDLQKGMDMVRNTSELKFNPIRFELCGTNGSVGTKGNNSNFFKSALSQNIVYSVWKEAKSVNEIADLLGVSPVYIESEAEILEEYGFLSKQGNKYLCNILLEETNAELIRLHDEMYTKAAQLFANELFDELEASNILEDQEIRDHNFILWSLIPYIAACSGESFLEKSIGFAQAATVRPDGGHNICYASVAEADGKRPLYFDSMRNWCGPCWNANEEFTLWQIDSEWSDRRVGEQYSLESARVLSLLSREREGALTPEEYSYLARQGIARITSESGGPVKASLQVVRLAGPHAKERLIAIGDRIKERHWQELAALKKPFAEAVLAQTPKQLRIMQKYGLQYTFFADGWFILHCMKELVNNGKLRLPAEDQKRSLTTIIITNH